MVRPLWHSDICTIHKIALQPVGNVVQQLYCVQLETKGVPIPEDGGTISDPELLMEVMEQRECIEETDDLAILQAMLQENKLLQQATTEVRSKSFMPICTGEGLCAIGYMLSSQNLHAQR